MSAAFAASLPGSRQGPDSKIEKGRNGISICRPECCYSRNTGVDPAKGVRSSGLRLALGWPAGGSKKNTGKGEARVRARKGHVEEEVRERVAPGAEVSYLLTSLSSPG